MSRDPKYGVELTADQLTTQDPCAVLYGVTPNNKFIPIQIDDDGKLQVGGVTVNVDTIDIGDVVIQGIDPDNGNAERTIAVKNLGSGNGFAVRSSIYNDDNQLDIDALGRISSNIFGNVGILNALNVQVDPSTEAKQTIGNSSLSSIDGKLTTLNAKDFATQTTLSLLNAKFVDGTDIGDVTINNGSGALAVNIQDGGNSITVDGIVDIGNFPLVQTIAISQSGTDNDVDAIQSGIWNTRLQDTDGNGITSTLNGFKQSLDVNITSGGSSTPTDTDDGSIATGQVAALGINLLYGYNGSTWERISSLSNSLLVDGSGSIQPVSQSGTWNLNNISGTISLPTGASTSDNQLTEISSLSSIDTSLDVALSTRASESTLSTLNLKFNSNYGASLGAIRTAAQIGNATGQAAFNAGTTDAQTLRVVLPTDQTAIPSSQSGIWSTRIQDSSGNSLTSTSSALDVNIKSGVTLEVSLDNNNDDVLIYGFDGTDNQKIKTDISGNLQINVLDSSDTVITPSQEHITAVSPHSVRLSDGAAFYKATTPTDTQPISAVSLPLPLGAATSANQSTEIASLSSIDGKFTTLNAKDFSTETTLSALNTKFNSNYGLVTGAIRTAAQIGNASGIASFGSGLIDAQTLRVVLPTDQTSIPVTQSGTWNLNNISGTISLPTLASTSTKQSDGSQKTQIVDGSGNVISSTGNALDVNIKSGVTLEVNLDNANDDVLVYGNDGVTNRAIKTDSSGNLQINILDSADAVINPAKEDGNLLSIKTNTDKFTFTATRLLVDGSGVVQPASQSGVWSTGRTWTLSSGTDSVAISNALLLDATFTTRINTLGQKTMANSTPVVLSSDQSVIPVSDNGGSLTVDGTVAATQSGTWSVRAQDGSGNSLTSQANGSQRALDVGIDVAGVQVDPRSIRALTSADVVTSNQGTANTIGNAWPTKITDGTNTLSISAASAAKVDGSAVTQPISAVSLPLPTGAATETTLSTRLADSTFTGRINTLGQKTSANSTPMVLASDQSTLNVSVQNSTLAVTQSGTWNLNNISGTISLPTGASTEATLANVLTTSAFQTRINTQGQKTMATSTPVVLASDQTVIPISDSGSSLTVDTPQLPAALVGSRLDTNVGAWLGSTAPTVGQKTMANSVPVVLSSDQSALPITQTFVAGTLANGAETAVAGSAVQVVASNSSRKILIVQNTGVANVRVGITGLTATTGLRLTPGSMFIFEMPYCPQAAIFAIREGAISSTVLAQEIT